ncbi:MAG: formyl transferase [Rhodospirillaceae bacterium]
MPLKKDIWHIGAVSAPLADILRRGIAGRDIRWLCDAPPLSFLADPFGVWRNGQLTVFAEAYDYKDRHGVIEVLTYDKDFRLAERRCVLNEPWHLSYPFIIESGGETYMLPEAFRSGGVTLYRCVEFPHRWAPVTKIILDQPPIDATPVRHNGMWWLFYTPATTREAKVSALHVAFAPALQGPWTPHPKNPVQRDASSSRPGGTPMVIEGALVIPMQDCRKTYGGAIRPLTIRMLTTTEFAAEPGETIHAANADGLHTLSAAGDLTLIDVKRFHLSAKSLALDVRHVWRKAFR